MLKTTVLNESSSYKVTIHELASAASVFATAVHNEATIPELQKLADAQSLQGVLATGVDALVAVKTFVYYLRSNRVNTAKYRTLAYPKLPALERYSFHFQITCIQLALQFKAFEFAKALVLEVRRESYFTAFTVVQFRRAFEVEGYLDDFLIEWATDLDSEDNWCCGSKLAALERCLGPIKRLRTLLGDYIEHNPDFAAENVSGESMTEHPPITTATDQSYSHRTCSQGQ